jgi:hypothetical protein
MPAAAVVHVGHADLEPQDLLSLFHSVAPKVLVATVSPVTEGPYTCGARPILRAQVGAHGYSYCVASAQLRSQCDDIAEQWWANCQQSFAVGGSLQVPCR